MYSDIKNVKGNGGYGGPLIIRPTKVKHKFIYQWIQNINT